MEPGQEGSLMDDFVLRDDSTAGSRSPLEGSLLMHLAGNVNSDRTWAVGINN